MWFELPAPPHIVNGIEKGSTKNCKYALRSDDEVRAYLSYTADDVNLRRNYMSLVGELRQQLRVGRMPFGRMDLPKLMSSLKLFERISRESDDIELHSLLIDVLGMIQQA